MSSPARRMRRAAARRHAKANTVTLPLEMEDGSYTVRAVRQSDGSLTPDLASGLDPEATRVAEWMLQEAISQQREPRSP